MSKQEGPWDVRMLKEVVEWLDDLDTSSRIRVDQAIDLLVDFGPRLGRPTVDTLKYSNLANLKELRSGTIRILFAFDPWRCGVLLIAGDKSGQWDRWYRSAIPIAEQRYDEYLQERKAEEEEGR